MNCAKCGKKLSKFELHEMIHCIEQLQQDRDALKSMLSDCVRMLEIVGVDSIPGDILAALAQHQRGEGEAWSG